MKCSDYDENCNGCPKQERCLAGLILATISSIAIFLLFLKNVPNEFRCEGKYCDIFPLWMIILFVCGIISVSVMAGFVAYFLTRGISFNIKNKRTYKF